LYQGSLYYYHRHVQIAELAEEGPLYQLQPSASSVEVELLESLIEQQQQEQVQELVDAIEDALEVGSCYYVCID
jgi:hypothetical protein